MFPHFPIFPIVLHVARYALLPAHIADTKQLARGAFLATHGAKRTGAIGEIDGTRGRRCDALSIPERCGEEGRRGGSADAHPPG
jgi:hypothetical protein